MTTRIELSIAGTPHARPRPRARAMFSKRQGRHIAVTYQPTRLTIGKNGKPTADSLAWVRSQEWYEKVRLALFPQRPSEPWSGPVRCTVDVYFERPQRLCKKSSPKGVIRHTGSPDRDNLDKAILDALTEAGLWADDGQVCDGPVRKWYAEAGCGPGVHIVAEQIPESEEELVF